MADIQTLDYVVIAVYFAAVFAIGLYIASKTHSGEDLFLAGRRLGFFAIGLSLFASNISSTTLIGLSGAAYSSGIAVSAYEWVTALILTFMAVVFIPIYLRTRVTTIPEWLELRFDSRLRSYFSAITIFLSILVDTAGGLYAGALVLKVFFPDLVIWQTCAVLAVVAGIYTAAGGLAAVVYTDVIQAVVLLIGTTVLTYTVFGAYDFSWSQAIAAVPPDHLHLIRPLDDPELPWLGLLFGVPILGFWYWTTNQYITQRVLGARSISHARWGALLGGALKLIPLFTMVLPGALALKLFPDLPKPDLVFPTLVVKMLPTGMVGLVLAGLIAAIMSSIDSTLGSASTLVVCDFLKAKKPNLTDKETARAGRITTLVLMVVAATWAPMIAGFGGLFAYLQQAFSVLVPPVAAIFVIGALWRRGTARGAFFTMIWAHALGLVIFVASQLGYWPLHYTVTAGLMTFLAAGVFLASGYEDAPPPSAKTEATTWRAADGRPADTATGLKDYRLWSVIVCGLVVTIVVYFW